MVKPLRVEKKIDLKLDLGCGKNPREGFEGVDSINFGQKHVLNLCKISRYSEGDAAGITFAKWPWKDNSVSEAYASHFIEHLDAEERIHFVNELYRVLIPEGKCSIIIPHWASCRAYGDLTHKWPPVSEFWFYYLSSDWRKDNAPHNDFYKCNFKCEWGYNLHPSLVNRNVEYQQNALQFWKEAALDIVGTMTKI